MSASDPNSAIYVTDSSKDIKNKVCSWFSSIFVVLLLVMSVTCSQKIFLCRFSV